MQPSPPTPPALSIIIVSWNVREPLRACLAGLPLADPQVEIIVVDSASADGTPAMVAADFPRVHLIASPANLGYARGNNLGLQAAQGRYLFVLNPDTVVLPGALSALTAYLDAHPMVALVGPQLLWPRRGPQGDDLPQPTRRRFPPPALLFFESTWLQRLAPRRWLRRYYAMDLPADAPADVDWLVGAALLVRRAAYEQVGGFDETFFMYSEELDWQRRLRAAGWRIVHLPAAQVLHAEAQSSAQAPAATHIRFNSSKVRYMRKYHGAAAAQALRLWLLAQFAAQLVLEAIKGALGHKRALRQARVAAYWAVLRSGLRG
ncbi:MAG: glycosyltransferase family 2 protein [Anaerolineales bacterium]|nr:glycosyltransferase family 2 protein [Anaerolineales bacterium]